MPWFDSMGVFSMAPGTGVPRPGNLSSAQVGAQASWDSLRDSALMQGPGSPQGGAAPWEPSQHWACTSPFGKVAEKLNSANKGNIVKRCPRCFCLQTQLLICVFAKETG